jgi:hypothetical protein
MGDWADGLITAGAEAADVGQIIRAFREGGGEGKPVIFQAAVSFARDKQLALQEAHARWRIAGLEAGQLADIPTPGEFDQATSGIRPETLKERLWILASGTELIERIEKIAELGVDEIYLHQVGSDWGGFMDLCREHQVATFKPR